MTGDLLALGDPKARAQIAGTYVECNNATTMPVLTAEIRDLAKRADHGSFAANAHAAFTNTSFAQTVTELIAAIREATPAETDIECPFAGHVDVEWAGAFGTWHCPWCDSEREIELDQ